MSEQPIFDHEKLDVYQVEFSFVAWSSILLSEIREAGEGLYREICDQLDRASLSALLNTAEGNGKRQGKQRAKFFDDARVARRMRGVSGRAGSAKAHHD
jgi:23S rRNA-intervening sequence protein